MTNILCPHLTLNYLCSSFSLVCLFVLCVWGCFGGRGERGTGLLSFLFISIKMVCFKANVFLQESNVLSYLVKQSVDQSRRGSNKFNPRNQSLLFSCYHSLWVAMRGPMQSFIIHASVRGGKTVVPCKGGNL